VAHGRRILFAGLALSCLWAAGCASKVAVVTPPPPLTERIPDAPSDSAGYVWIPGRWLWRHGGYIWAQGHWALPPYPGAVWVPDQWSPGRSAPDVLGHWK
jgi:hypothetical protein